MSGSAARDDVACAGMELGFITPAAPADAAAVTEVVARLESSLYGDSVFSQADLEVEWSELDRERDTRVVRDGDRVVGYGAVRERGDVPTAARYVLLWITSLPESGSGATPYRLTITGAHVLGG